MQLRLKLQFTAVLLSQFDLYLFLICDQIRGLPSHKSCSYDIGVHVDYGANNTCKLRLLFEYLSILSLNELCCLLIFIVVECCSTFCDSSIKLHDFLWDGSVL